MQIRTTAITVICLRPGHFRTIQFLVRENWVYLVMEDLLHNC